MLRAVIALGGTAAGLAALLSFKTHPAALASSVPATTPNAGMAATPSTAPKQSTTATGAKGAAAKGTSGSQSSGGGTTTAQSARTINGAVESTQYGPMQVQVTVLGKKITNVQVLQQTNLGSYSQQVDAMAIPKLNAETLAAQSAQISAVSGASYTSQGYIQSLQSALDKVA